jgi:hypothetical protein
MVEPAIYFEAVVEIDQSTLILTRMQQFTAQVLVRVL